MKIINKQIKIEIEAIVNLFIDSITSKKNVQIAYMVEVVHIGI